MREGGPGVLGGGGGVEDGVVGAVDLGFTCAWLGCMYSEPPGSFNK